MEEGHGQQAQGTCLGKASDALVDVECEVDHGAVDGALGGISGACIMWLILTFTS